MVTLEQLLAAVPETALEENCEDREDHAETTADNSKSLLYKTFDFSLAENKVDTNVSTSNILADLIESSPLPNSIASNIAEEPNAYDKTETEKMI